MAGGRILLIATLVLVSATAGPAVLPAPRSDAAAGCGPGTSTDRSASRWTGVVVREPGAWGARLSEDGRYAAFASYEDDLVAGDTNDTADVFWVDRVTGEILRASVDPHGLQYRDHAAEASISADGTRVAFSAGYGVYVRDIRTAQTAHVSVNDTGVDADDWSGAPVVSAAGLVAFTSRATNLAVPDRTRGGSLEAYLRDLGAGTTERISIGAGGVTTPTWSWAEAVSEDGRFVAFTAGAAGGQLTPDDVYPGADVFVRDRQAQTTELISVAPDGRSIGGWFLGMSADGMRVLFGAGPQPDAKPAVFLRDRVASTTRLIAPLVTTWRRSAGSHPAPLAMVGQRAGPPAALSGDGRLAAVQTAFPTGPDDTNGSDDIVVVDLTTGASQPASRSSSGCPGNGASGEATLSHNGSVVGFTSEADDLVSHDNRRLTSVYVRDMAASRTERLQAARPTGAGP